MGLSVIAEGVENDGAMALLRSYHCDMVQGYLFSPPLQEAELLDWCRRDLQSANAPIADSCIPWTCAHEAAVTAPVRGVVAAAAVASGFRRRWPPARHRRRFLDRGSARVAASFPGRCWPVTAPMTRTAAPPSRPGSIPATTRWMPPARPSLSTIASSSPSPASDSTWANCSASCRCPWHALGQDVFGAKLRVAGDLVYTRMPQVSVGRAAQAPARLGTLPLVGAPRR